MSTDCRRSIIYFSWQEAFQILTRPSSPPVTIIQVLKSRLRAFVTLMQLIGTPGWAYSNKTKYFELQYVEISPRLFPNTTSD
jgi:hypothetical protein